MTSAKALLIFLPIITALVGCSANLPSLLPASQPQSAPANRQTSRSVTAIPLNYDAYDAILQRYVNEQGFVDYRGLQVNPEPLKAFNRSLGEVDPDTFAAWGEADQIAFLINAYNAFTLESIIDQRPLKASIRDIPGVWRIRKFQVAGQSKTNNNYRFVEMCVQRLLGRQVYNNRETLSWSIVLATQGLRGFIDALLNSEEYLTQFGDATVPYQRRRILPSQTQGELPFARMARYDRYHLNQIQQLTRWRQPAYGMRDRSAPVYRRVLVAVPTMAVALLVITLVSTIAPQ
ncbi:phycobilisome rod-core linker polypeptide [Leptolyngbya sp. 7M]|uniref:phycobilisome rod-core linker polypeptide n=1 Tax=Leptolyngbya sp. 7M TaxID=2812896 RepID=UPI001B8CE202|nr:phycobilisome rod-core linker polypeptide [Leptolyngbya sp. 7M]QYO63831.1 phycobilisome rod-core linker polypeptide [Leptolyngbya sp. 7M]